MGAVYRPRDPRLGRDVAIKLCPGLQAAHARGRAGFVEVGVERGGDTVVIQWTQDRG